MDWNKVRQAGDGNPDAPIATLLEVCWYIRTPNGKAITRGVYRDEAPGPDVRAQFSDDDLLRSERAGDRNSAGDRGSMESRDSRQRHFRGTEGAPKHMITAVYCRKSTEQGGADEAKSVTRQIEHSREYARRKGWTVADEHVYVDDGISGAEFSKRQGFLRLMNALKPRTPFQVC